jgi:hypothetical protein
MLNLTHMFELVIDGFDNGLRSKSLSNSLMRLFFIFFRRGAISSNPWEKPFFHCDLTVTVLLALNQNDSLQSAPERQLSQIVQLRKRPTTATRSPLPATQFSRRIHVLLGGEIIRI